MLEKKRPQTPHISVWWSGPAVQTSPPPAGTSTPTALWLCLCKKLTCNNAVLPVFFPHWVILVITSAVCLITCNYLSRSWFKLSMSSDLRLSLRIFFFFSLSVCLLPLRFSVCRQVEGIRTHLLDTSIRCSVCPPASACTLQNGGWWGSSFSWHHLRLSSWLPPLPYEFSHPRFEKIKTILLWLGGLCGYILGGSLHTLTPPDASAALSPSRCGSFAALLAQPGDFPA